MATFSELITRTITRLSMVPGFGAQTYAEDQIAEMIWHKFLTARDELWWDDLMTYVTVTVDADGVPTDTIVRIPSVPADPSEIVINKYTDIQHTWAGTDPNPIQSRPRRVNPDAALRTYRKLVGPHDTKVVRWWGTRAGDVMGIRYKLYYPMFEASDEVPFDEQLLILGASWDYLEDDGSNPQQIEKFRNLYMKRFDQLARAENDETIPLGVL